MNQCLVFSLLLHSVLLSLLLLRFPAPKPVSETLTVELYGMVADRQDEEKIEGRDAKAVPPAPKPTPAPPPQVFPPSPTVPKENKAPDRLVRAPESPVLVEEKTVTAPPKEQSKAENFVATTASNAPTAPVVPIGNADELRKQARLNVQDKSLDALKQYLGRVQKKLQANLVYPDEAKKNGHDGATVVRFTMTEAGTIKPGTLSVLRSSGYINLDENALRSARESVPFERPSREIDVSVSVSFGMSQ